MLPETYGNSLKKLITFTQAKFISLASIVGYDVSYVNKWSNGSKLPSSRYIIRINEELGKYFADTIKESGREDEFYQSFGITPNDADLHVSITNYLCTSYRRTIGRSRVNKERNVKTNRRYKSSWAIMIRRSFFQTFYKKAWKALQRTASSSYSENSLPYTMPAFGIIFLTLPFIKNWQSASVSIWISSKRREKISVIFTASSIRTYLSILCCTIVRTWQNPISSS